MTLFRFEMKKSRTSLWIWTLSISMMMAICILIFPEMGSEMESAGEIFANMGSFTAAFGMDRLNIGEFIGFFSIECGNILGLGGAMFAALIGISALSKEEGDHTADFLMTHPICRKRTFAEKLLSVLAQLVILNLFCCAVTYFCAYMIHEEFSNKVMLLTFLANFLLQLEMAMLTFGISAFLRRNNVGIGLGISIILYFVNLLANLTENLDFLKYLTPFSYIEGADIVCEEALSTGYLTVGLLCGLVVLLAGFFQYNKKDFA